MTRPTPRSAPAPGRRLAQALALVLALAACADEQAASARGPNVLLVTVDTLRADRLGCYGNHRDLTPAADALAAEGTLFERAYAPAPWTMPSVASIHTGLYPRSHTVRRPGDVLPPEARTLAETLGVHGWRTHAITSNRLLADRMGYGQGFAAYDAEEGRGHDWISTPGVTERAVAALGELASHEEPWFLSVLYFDPHYDWLSHGLGLAAAGAGRLDGDESIEELRALAAEGAGLTAHEVGFLRDRYDEEVRFTDDGLARLLAELDAQGVADDTLVVFTADHGEEFLEHGWLGHTRFLYEGMLRVPLVVRDPATRALGARRVDGPVSTVSVMATVLDRVGIDPAPLELQGPSLLPWLAGDPTLAPPAGPVHAEVDFVPAEEGHEDKAAHLEAVVTADLKLIRDVPTGKLEVYRPLEDPLERTDLGVGAARGLMDLLLAWRGATRERALPPRRAIYSEEEAAELRNLGYLDAGDR